ncbi:MAG: regulatory protein RecX [candidate division Zixibacteria bacterium]|nr:regulatory protein RecX [candidate division Zixibacteria bacterium]
MKDKCKVINISKKPGCCQILLSNDEKVILSWDILKKYQLKKGSEIATEDLYEIKTESDLIRAENYCSYLLARREYSSGMLKSKLLSKSYDLDISNTVINKLKQALLVDDNRFARMAIEIILRNKPAGRAYLIAYLKSKYISRELAETVVDEQLENIDEKELAERLLKRRFRQYLKFDLETARRKAYNYLSRRAIGYGAAKFAFEKICREEQVFNEKNEELDN